MTSAAATRRFTWRRNDAWVLVLNVAAFAAHLGNTAWRSVEVVYLATAVPLAILAVRCRKDPVLRWSLGFGVATALLWALVEGGLARLFGWWGSYGAIGPRVWDTPMYCLLVGAQACSYVAYVALRSLEARLSRRRVAVLTGLHAFALAVGGENLLVAAGMWTYRSWGTMWGEVPLWVVAGYASTYVALPWIRGMRAVPAAALFSALTFMNGIVSALVVGFRGVAGVP